MKLSSLLVICLAVTVLSDDSAKVHDFRPYPVCSPLPIGKKCPACTPFQRCCGVVRKVCAEQCKNVCISSNGSRSPILRKCPLKRVCSPVPPASCKGNKSGCICTAIPANQCKPVCKMVKKQICPQVACLLEEKCNRACTHDGECDHDCKRGCPPPVCETVPVKVCEPPVCRKCVSCKYVPDCSVKCGAGYCKGANGDKCGENCAAVCSNQVVPACVPKLRPFPALPVKDKDDDDDFDDDKDDDDGFKKGHH